MVSDLDKAGMQIDIGGSGVMDVFNPYLPVSYIHSEFRLPRKNSQNYEASHDFDIDPSIINPFFYVTGPEVNMYFNYYFTKLSDTRWRVTLWGIGWMNAYYDNSGNIQGYFPWKPYWEEPLMHNGIAVVVGGYRG